MIYCIYFSSIPQSPIFQTGGYGGASNATHLASATSAELDRLDWRLALGEVSMNLRREVSDKASREELYSAVRTEIGTLEERLSVNCFLFVLISSNVVFDNLQTRLAGTDQISDCMPHTLFYLFFPAAAEGRGRRGLRRGYHKSGK